MTSSTRVRAAAAHPKRDDEPPERDPDEDWPEREPESEPEGEPEEEPITAPEPDTLPVEPDVSLPG